MATILTSIHGRRVGLSATGALVIEGGAIASTSDGPITLAGGAKVPSHTVANAPSAATAGAGALIYVTNGNAGSACLAVSDGTNWKVVALGATIAAA